MASHGIRGRQLSRDTEHRAALRRNMVQSLFEHGSIRTTLPRAKEVRPFAEKLITLARGETDLKKTMSSYGDTEAEYKDAQRRLVNNRRRVTALMHDRRLVDSEQEFTGQKIVQKLFTEIAPKFADRDGGYTRIIKLSDYRIGDGGSIVILQLLTEESKPSGTARKSAGFRRKRIERKHKFATEIAASGRVARVHGRRRSETKETGDSAGTSPAATGDQAATPAT
jgi:large subunit ribosomal protein L17